MQFPIGSLYRVGGTGLTHELDGNAYAVIDGGEVALIDCGSPEGFPYLKRQLARLDIKIGGIAYVLATHGHRDHIGAMSLITQDNDRANLYIGAGDWTAATSGDYYDTAGFLYRRSSPRIAPERTEIVADGQKFYIGRTIITVLATPGHSPGSICYRVEQPAGTVLVGGDTLHGDFFPDAGSHLPTWRLSLDRLLLQAEQYDFYTFGHVVGRLVPNVPAQIIEALEDLNRAYKPDRWPYTKEDFRARGRDPARGT